MGFVRVGLVMTTDSEVNRGLSRGIGAYAHPPREWMLRNVIESAGEGRNPDLASWHDLDCLIVGFIGHDADRWHEWVRRSGLPFVEWIDPIAGASARLQIDFDSVASAAIEHYLARGFRRIGHVRWGAPFPDTTLFEELARRHGLQCDSFLHENPETADYSPAADRRLLSAYLKRIRKPIGLLAAHDFRARQVVDCCRLLGIRVPEDVAALGVENEPTEIAMTHPQLSSIAMATEQAGYLAAETLETVLKTGKSPRDVIPIRATRVVARQSTDVYAVADEDVRDALAYIGSYATKGATAAAVHARVNVARRSLERRFRALLGRSILEEIHRIRIERAKCLLADTSLQIATIASECGYSEQKLLTTAFRAVAGCTPREWRKQSRPGNCHGLMAK